MGKLEDLKARLQILDEDLTSAILKKDKQTMEVTSKFIQETIKEIQVEENKKT